VRGCSGNGIARGVLSSIKPATTLLAWFARHCMLTGTYEAWMITLETCFNAASKNP
jgi:hypothetical protein